MVDVSLRHKRADGPATRDAGRYGASPLRRRPRSPAWLLRPVPLAVGGILAAIALIVGGRAAITAYHASTVLSGFVSEVSPIEVTIAGHHLAIPANMIRSAKVRRGGETELVELALHWPTLSGYSEGLAEEFRGETGSSAILYASLSPQSLPADSTGRLVSVYARFFEGPASPGPNGLVGRRLAADSGYGGEILYFTPKEIEPFVTRCIDSRDSGLRGTCMRDIALGNGLALQYRFDSALLGQWESLDSAMRRLADVFAAPG